jgi:hypothetical protein
LLQATDNNLNPERSCRLFDHCKDHSLQSMFSG